jgi:four helix bundle protein
MENKKKNFAFKDLLVWQRGIDFADTIIGISENLNTSVKHYRLVEQLESSSASVAQNIAEGKGRRSKKEFIQFLYIARGSLYETVTLINLFAKRKWITSTQLEQLENQAFEIVSMLKGLINSIANSD